MKSRYQTIVYSRMHFYIQVFVLPGAQPIICHWISNISNGESWGGSQRTQIKTSNQVPFARYIRVLAARNHYYERYKHIMWICERYWTYAYYVDPKHPGLSARTRRVLSVKCLSLEILNLASITS